MAPDLLLPFLAVFTPKSWTQTAIFGSYNSAVDFEPTDNPDLSLPFWGSAYWVVLIPTRSLHRAAGPPSVRLTSLPVAALHYRTYSQWVSGRHRNFRVISGQNMSWCRQPSRGWLWSVSLASGVSLHITKTGPRWDEEPLISLGLMRPLILGCLRASAHSPPGPPRAW